MNWGHPVPTCMKCTPRHNVSLVAGITFWVCGKAPVEPQLIGRVSLRWLASKCRSDRADHEFGPPRPHLRHTPYHDDVIVVLSC